MSKNNNAVLERPKEVLAMQPAKKFGWLRASGLTLISPGAALNGSLRTYLPLHLDGDFTGRIDTTDDILIAESAVVQADVSACRVILAGRFQGTMRLDKTLEITPTGRFQGILYIDKSALTIADGGLFLGQIRNSDDGPPVDAPAPKEAPSTVGLQDIDF